MGMLINSYELGAAASLPDANTLFLARFQVSPPVNEVGGAAGTLVGNASCDTANSQLVLDGTGDYATWVGGVAFDATTNWTIEFHTNQAAAQVGAIVARTSSGVSRYAVFADGTGSIGFYADNFSSGASVVTFGIADGNEHHVAICRDGGTYRLYNDGVQVFSAAWAGAPSSSGDTFFVGADALATASRDLLARLGRVKLSNICRYPSGTAFTAPSRTAA